jgi:ADP-ribose pyrophosphatase
MKTHGPWKIVSSEEVYRDHWLTLRKDEVIRPDGLPGTYSVATLMSGVCVLALDDDNQVYLTEEFHYGVGRTTLEAVSGGVEVGEDAAATARRELAEELGIVAEEWRDMGAVDPLTGSMVSPARLYLAQKLQFGATDHEGTEQIRCVQMSLADAVQMVMSSEITHGPSCVLILKTAQTEL